MQTKVKLGIKPKFDLWFLILLTVILWSVVFQFFGLILYVIGAGINNPANLADANLWIRLLSTGLAVYGIVWVLKIYIHNIKDKTLKDFRQKQVIRDFICNEFYGGNFDAKCEQQAEQLVSLLRDKED